MEVFPATVYLILAKTLEGTGVPLILPTVAITPVSEGDRPLVDLHRDDGGSLLAGVRKSPGTLSSWSKV